jgi:eukaryotic-like serine/threonine-protein kinase
MLTPGTKLGPYEIQSPLGAGGMGEVYRARDTRLDRTVAIKVLASHLSSSPELKQRMDREARAISSLNHPNICQLHDIGSQDGAEFLVMEFLEGETLAERLKRSPLPLPEIFKIGIAIAEALAVAHRNGIVHRDLKPGNIMLTQSGAKLMDFGLAKPLGIANSGSGSNAAPPSFTAAVTLSGPSPLSPLTTAGTIIGTIQYMSPEQIEGKEADARSDIFAFGAVLYEMTAGKRPFEGKSQLSLASSILEKDPDSIIAVKPHISPAFEHIITTCLQKNPDDRYLAAHDIKLELQWLATEKPALAVPALQPDAPLKQSRPAWIAAVIVAIALSAIAGFLLHRPAPAPSIHTVINAPEKTHINLNGDNAGPPVLSPDGSTIAFAAVGSDSNTTIWVRPVNSLEARQVSGTEGAIFPFWSFDNHSLGFFADGKLKIVDISGGPAQIIADAAFGRGGAWGAERVMVFSPATTGELYRVSADGGAPAPITKMDAAQHTSHRWPFFLPDGKHFLYLAMNHDTSKSANDTIYYASVDGSVNQPLFKNQSNAIYADGYILFARNEELLAQAFNPSSGTLSGEPQPLARGVVNDSTTWHMDASASNDGLLIHGSGGSGNVELLWMDRASRQLSTIAGDLGNLKFVNLSPQGDRIALVLDNGVSDIWMLDLARGTRTRLTFGPVVNIYPQWSPDGKWIVYSAGGRNGKFQLLRKPYDGSGTEEELLSDDRLIIPNDWSCDGKYILYQRGMPGSTDIWALPLQGDRQDGDRKPFQVVTNTPNTFRAYPKLSPDGRWLAYESNESGSFQAYVAAFNGGHGKWQISVNGGQYPTWSQDGKHLYFVDAANTIYAVPVQEAAGALQFGAPQTLVSTWSMPVPFYQISPDDKKILLYRISQQVSDSVTVVTNFTAALKK